MSEYKLIELHDKENCLLQALTSGKYYIFCNDKQEAHTFKLSLMLETLANPIEAPELYDLYEVKGYQNVHRPKSLAFADDEAEDINSCCQSGCPGCPYYKAN